MSTAVTRQSMISTQLLAASMPKTPGVYFIGQMASRLSFSSQQRRAFAVVAELNDDLIRAGHRGGLEGKSVCIIGAGLAGLSAAIAAVSFSANVTIIEKHSPPDSEVVGLDDSLTKLIPYTLPRWRHAAHRNGHPTLNFWPIEDLDPVTVLPALNWYEGPCPDIAQMVMADFTRLLDKGTVNHRLKAIHLGLTVSAFKERRRKGRSSKLSEAGKFTLELKAEKGKRPPPNLGSKEFDILVFASGYGGDAADATNNSSSYWNRDGDVIGKIIDGELSNFRAICIGGNGDGGVVELLRLVYQNFTAGAAYEPFYKTVQLTDHKDYFARVEYSCTRTYLDRLLSRAELPKKESVEDELARIVSECYFDYIYSDDGLPIFRDLHAAMVDSSQEIILLGKTPSPLGFGVAPVHRLMLAAAIAAGKVRYVQHRPGEMHFGSRNGPVYKVITIQQESCWRVAPRHLPRHGQSPTNIHTKRKAKLTRRDVVYLPRHGPYNDLEALLERDVIADLEYRQKLYADQDLLKPHHAHSIATNLGLPDPTKIEDVAGERSLARSYFEDKFGIALSPRGPSTKSGQRHAVIGFYCLRNPSGPELENLKDKLPKKLFGFELVPISEQEATGLT